MSAVIRVHALGKRYQIGAQQKTYKTFQETLLNVLKSPAKNFRRIQNLARRAEDSDDIIWALKDVSFEVKQGEVIGIIGKNGSGKSTLLKILSRITEPTEGSVELRGRVSSLLEVGTGFHRELTGRENIYLNGSILGMRKWEIDKKFDEIVAFSEIEKFIDTPVKHYSSGMYVRLAFAVAAHMEPEILLVDEVLAVGDAAFQKKCLGKMGDIAKEGRTVLFVSHNMGAISSLTKSCLLINDGILKEKGSSKEIIAHYLDEGYQKIAQWYARFLNNKPMQITKAEICPDGDFFDVKNNIKIIIDYVVREPVHGAVVSVIIHGSDGASIIGTEDIDMNPGLLERRLQGKYRTILMIPGNWLSAGKYLLRLHCGVVFQSIFDDIEALSFELVETGDPKIRQHKQAYILPYLEWKVEKS